jgi:phosphoglycolate phosphatase
VSGVMIKRINIENESIVKEVLHLQFLSYSIEAELIEFDELPPLKDTLDSLQQSGETFFGYYEKDELWGVISYKIDDRVVDIHRLMVHPNQFRKRVAEKLLAFLEMQGKDKDSMIVSTGSKNIPALNFYKKFGFETIDEKELTEGLCITSLSKNCCKQGGLMLDSIIFDLDGTLWDPRKTVVYAWNKVIENHDKVKKELTSQQLKETMGLQMHEIGRKLFPELQENEREQFLNTCSEVEKEHLREKGGNLYENVEEVLEDLAKKYKLFIVSNCQHGYIEAFYEYHRLEKHFIDYENPGRTGLSKGENIKLIIERNHLKQPVYVGDTDGDWKSAKDAGIPFVYARYGFGEASNYDYVIDSFEEMNELF